MSAPVVDTIEDPKKKEEHFVHEVYNEIAPHFSQTRYKPWPIVENFLVSQKDYSVGIDVGCGNGKYLGVNPKLFLIGSDRSVGLIECAKKISDNKFEVCLVDGLNLPHPDNKFDFAISIAVIHHFSTKERRIEAVKEIMSKIKSGGEFLVYCWALEQEKSRRGYKSGDEQDVLVPWVTQKQTKKKSVGKKDTKEVKDEEGSKVEKKVNYRYYHLYKKGELEEDIVSVPGCCVRESGYERDNWWAIVRKN